MAGTNQQSGVGRACPLCPGISDVNLFHYRQGVIDLDAEIPDRCYRSWYDRARAELLSGCLSVGRSGSGGLWIIIDRLAGLLAQFKSDRPPGFLLPERCAIGRPGPSRGKCPVAFDPKWPSREVGLAPPAARIR